MSKINQRKSTVKKNEETLQMLVETYDYDKILETLIDVFDVDSTEAILSAIKDELEDQD